MICATVSAGFLLRNEQASISARTSDGQSYAWFAYRGIGCTSQSINCPLFKLLESDLSGWRNLVEIQPVGVVMLFVGGSCELLLFVVKGTSALWVDATVILSYHSCM